MTLDTIRVLQVQTELEAISRIAEDAETIGLDPTSVKAVVKRVKKAMLVDLDKQLDREAALEALGGLSERSLLRRPHTGTGADARWRVRDLIVSDPPETDREQVGAQAAERIQEEDCIELAAEEAAQEIAS